LNKNKKQKQVQSEQGKRVLTRIDGHSHVEKRVSSIRAGAISSHIGNEFIRSAPPEDSHIEAALEIAVSVSGRGVGVVHEHESPLDLGQLEAGRVRELKNEGG
jgi:hypothetical protein